MQDTQVEFLGQEDPLEEEMATHSSILAWETPWTEEPGGLQSLGSRSRTWLSDFHFFHWWADKNLEMSLVIDFYPSC